jgi:gluconolactonase
VTGTLTGLVRLVRLVTADAHEGPSWFADEDALYVTTTRGPHGTAILRIALDGLLPVGPHAVTVLRADANVANGTAADAAGRLIVCEQGSRTTPARIAAVDRATGAATTLVDSYRGLPLNSPNDVVVRRDGTVWFTDPAYGAAQGFREPARLPDQVYRLDPATGGLTVVATGFDHPNGLAFDPDERVLYVADSGADRGDGRFEPDRPHEVLAFPVLGDRLGPRRRFAELPGAPDGIAVDARGRVHVAACGGVHVFASSGEPVGLIALPGAVNLTFGGPDGTVLFVTTDTAVWAAVPDAEGASS